MSTLSPAYTLTPEQKASFERDGFLAVSGLFSPEEVQLLLSNFMRIQQRALDPDDALREYYRPLTLEQAGGDVLKHFPRIMHPARYDRLSMQYMMDARIGAVLEQLLEEEPLAAQSMFYFKPPGARGQALHQDNFYLNVRPGTCMAAWVSLDPADEANGGMFMVPGSHRLDVLCPHMADMEKSFTTEEVDIPEGMEAVQVPLKAGDVLFFNGSVIHGSYPNTTTDRFRRAFICHYVGDSTTEMAAGYYPLVTFSGDTLRRGEARGGLFTCGAEDWETYTRLRAEWQRDHAQASGAGAAS